MSAFEFISHSNGEVTPVKISSLIHYNDYNDFVYVAEHIDLTLEPVDLTIRSAAQRFFDESSEEDSEDEASGLDSTDESSTDEPSQANSGTTHIFPAAHLFCDTDDDSDGPFYIMEPDYDSNADEYSVVSRLSMEEDDTDHRCLTCATWSQGGWKHCAECYKVHYRGW
jgi:hypothetical protein